MAYLETQVAWKWLFQLKKSGNTGMKYFDQSFWDRNIGQNPIQPFLKFSNEDMTWTMNIDFWSNILENSLKSQEFRKL